MNFTHHLLFYGLVFFPPFIFLEGFFCDICSLKSQTQPVIRVFSEDLLNGLTSQMTFAANGYNPKVTSRWRC